MLEEGIYRVLGGLESISGLLILRGVLWTLDKDSLRSLLCVNTVKAKKNQIIFCKIVALSRLTELPIFKALLEYSNIIVAWDHLNLIEWVFTFHLDPFLLNLKVCSSTFIRSKVSTWSASNLKKLVMSDHEQEVRDFSWKTM